MNQRPVCNFEFACCGPVEKKLEPSICPGLVVGADKVEWVANFWISKSWFFYFELNFLAQIMDFIPSFLNQHLEQPVSVHMQKKWGELGQKWPS